MPTAKGAPTPNKGSVTLSPLRRSTRKTKSTQPFDNSTDDSKQPSPAVDSHPSSPNHDLMQPTTATDNPTTVEVDLGFY